MDFLYPLLNFFQPGIFWPQLAFYKPMLIMSVLAVIGARASREQLALLKKGPLVWALVFALVQAASVYYSGMLSMLSTFGFWYVYPMFTAISVLLMGTERALRRYVWGMLIGSMFVVAYGIYAKYSGINSIYVQGVYFMRGRAGAYGMYHDQNDYSFIIIQIVPFLYVYALNTERFLARILLYASTIACAAGILLCLSRGGMLALVLEGFLLLLFTTRRRTQLLLIPLFAALAFGGIGYQWKMRAQSDGTNYTYSDSKDTRLELWRAARVMVERRPILGVGSDRFQEYARDYYPLSHDDLGKNAHNTYLDIAASSGLLGIGTFVMMLASTFRELKTKYEGAPKWVELTRMAAFIAFLAILLRAFLDAKEHDWSFYTLAAISIATAGLGRRLGATSGAGTVHGQSLDHFKGPASPTYPLGGVASSGIYKRVNRS